MNKEQPKITPFYDCDYQLFDTHLEFYTAMGFTITYYQKAPYRFASVERAGIGEFGFYGVKKFEEEGNKGGCYVQVPNVREVYEELKANLKSYYGKIPTKGTPRFSRLNKTAEDWRVNITDASGNCIIIGEPLGDSTELMAAEEARVKALTSKFEKAYAQAYRFAYSKEDFLAARNTLEVAFLKFHQDASNEVLFKAKVLQAEVFSFLDQKSLAEKSVQQAYEIELKLAEKETLKETFQKLEEIKEQIS
ncbi:VOC family protein [Sutcliffiella rhizosphaerae]|uniref:VOC family protein n=1 Tax=Sutcliffiella rhizosphaerae TaxID=2880967 RepID=A0ABN8AFR4_9BACI|nr:hypothetical protein [Sutcliffiella rhizosphaerae]CAG9623039.1 hypothetical protein BACCIP111883_03834 [Sutcliffiella rhizosphaerae]